MLRRRHFLPLLLLVLPAAAAAPRPAIAQQQPPPPQPVLRPAGLLDGPVVRLSDIFDGLGARGDAVLGPAPAPGRRLVVEAPQLQAIARRHGIAWRPFTAEDRAVLERPGRPVAREEVLELLRAALAPLGLDAEAELELAGYVPPQVPLSGFVHLALEQASFDAAQGRFAVTLVVTAEEMPALRQRLAGRAAATVPVVLATRRMAMGEVLRPADLRLARVRAERLRPGAAQQLDHAIGQRLRRPVAADQPLAMADLAAPPVVERQGLVTMVMEQPGLTLTMQGRALEAAVRGARVPVMNLASRMVVEAEAIGPGRVRVLPGSVPIGTIPPGATTLAALR